MLRVASDNHTSLSFRGCRFEVVSPASSTRVRLRGGADSLVMKRLSASGYDGERQGGGEHDRERVRSRRDNWRSPDRSRPVLPSIFLDRLGT